MRRCLLLVLCLGCLVPQAHAGLYIPAEPPLVPNPDLLQFLQNLSDLRGYGPPDGKIITQETHQRETYLGRIAELRAKQKGGTITADELASLGAYLVRVRKTQLRLPDVEEAVQVLEAARRAHPRHFAILANLGTAYQLTGRLDAAKSCLEEAYTLAPQETKKAERAQYVLVSRRAGEPLRPTELALDQPFAPRVLSFVRPGGTWEIGKLAESEATKFPGGSVAETLQVVQQLLLWLPDDGRLYWLFGELANAHGNIAAAYGAMNTAVDLFRLSVPTLKQHRFLLQEAMEWREIVNRLGPPAKVQEWLALHILWGMHPTLAPADIAPMLTRVSVAMPLPGGGITTDANLSMFRPDPEVEAHMQPPPKVQGQMFALEQRHWLMIGFGIVVIMVLAGLQVREVRRRRRRVTLGRAP